jgi:hypothetical protein
MPLPQRGLLGSLQQQEQQEARGNEDATTFIIGQDLQIAAADLAAVQDTEDHEKVINTMRDYRNRIQRLCEWLQKEFPEYVELGGVVPITNAQKSDRVFFAYKSILDLRYQGLNVDFIKLYMAARKVKADGKILSHGHIRKYHDAILWGAEKAAQTLPLNFRPKMKKFLEWQNTELLTYLKRYVTIKPSNKMTATGVPPHVKQLKILRALFEQNQSILTGLSNLVPQMAEKVTEAIENAAITGGNVTPTYLQNLITQVTDKIDGLDRRFNHVEGLIKEGVPLLQQPQATSATVFDSSSTPGQWRYCYGGRFYSVPKGFELPMKLKLRAAFGLWINGDPSRKSYQKLPGSSEEVLTATPIKSYRMIKTAMLPKNVANQFKASWMPILKLMTSVCNNLPALATGQALDELYKQGLDQVRKNAAYIFAKGGYTDWTLSTWSRKISPSAIKNNGTAADNARLERIPVPHQRKRKRKASIENNGQQRLIPTPAQQRLIPAPARAAVSGDRRRPTSKGHGYCSIQGCTNHIFDHDHPCFKQGCPYYVHSLCGQDHKLLDKDNELNMYCSESCKEQG